MYKNYYENMLNIIVPEKKIKLKNLATKRKENGKRNCHKVYEDI